jgi:hypothetical protein
MTDGGDGVSGYRHTEECKKIMSNLRKGRTFKPLSEQHKNKLRKTRPHASKNIAEGLSKLWYITFPDGHLEQISNLNEFCRKYGLAAGNLYKTVTGETKQHKGFSAKKC